MSKMSKKVRNKRQKISQWRVFTIGTGQSLHAFNSRFFEFVRIDQTDILMIVGSK